MNKIPTLVIVGNGFDLALGYDTKYSSFANSYDKKSLKDFCGLFEEYLVGRAEDREWTDFENNIRDISNAIFREYGREEDKKHYNAIKKLNCSFDEIKALLMQYLLMTVDGSCQRDFISLRRYVDEDTPVINFNYTNTFETYSKNICYIHGSLVENDIVLGFDNRFIGCLETFEFLKWIKREQRLGLMFRRYLRNELGMSDGEEDFERINSSFVEMQRASHTGRGEFDTTRENEENTIINRFSESEIVMKEGILFDLTPIRRLVVVGHGLKSDQRMLENIIRRCSKLEVVIVYSYKGENKCEFCEKMSFFLDKGLYVKKEMY